MKRIKRLLALALAMMMAFAMMAIPAAAHGEEDEGIMPLYEVGPCTICGEYGRVERRTYSSEKPVNSCSKKDGFHYHTETSTFWTFPECGHMDHKYSETCNER